MKNNSEIKSWIGKSVENYDNIDDFPIKAMAAVFNYNSNDKNFKKVPYGWHWLYFLNLPLQKNLGHDGHEKRVGFMPPIDLPIRMYAGGKINYHSPILIGEKLKKHQVLFLLRIKKVQRVI